MDLHFESGPGGHQIRECTAEGIRVDDRLITASFLLTPQRIDGDIGITSIEALDDAAQAEQLTARLLDLQPEVVLLGSGLRLQFPSTRFQAGLLKLGIGLETMDNAAAARTFNLLAGENRRVIAVFLLPGASSSH